MQTSPILIIGGGIGGLSLALALAKRGVASHVFEQADAFSEVGAGLQLSPNAVRRLKSFGFDLITDLNSADSKATQPEKITIYDSTSGAEVSHIPLGAFAEARYGAPYLVMARPDLLDLMVEAASNEPLIELSTSKRLIHIYQDGNKVTATMEDESAYEGALMVAADGVWSRVRTLINRESTPQQTGLIAWRALIDKAAAPPRLSGADTSVFLGPGAHLVQYRVSGGNKVNLVAVTKGEARQRSWAEVLPAELLYEEIRCWHKPLRQEIMKIKDWQAWPLMLLKPFQPWSKGRVVLLGDAAHAIVPFLAQGAAMAIEDAHLLADLIANLEDRESRQNVETLFSIYEATRYKRCQRVLSKSIYNLQFYHAGGFLRPVRNGMLRLASPRMLLRQYDWLYKA